MVAVVGKWANESREFLDGLKGNDPETLRWVDKVDRLGYFLPNRFLKQITLVHTSGTGAMVKEHGTQTAEFMKLNSQLRDRHDRDTRRFDAPAD